MSCALWSLRLDRDRQDGGPPGLSERRVQDGLHAPVADGDRVAEVRQEAVGRHEQGHPRGLAGCRGELGRVRVVATVPVYGDGDVVAASSSVMPGTVSPVSDIPAPLCC